jgi:hypothetical protein
MRAAMPRASSVRAPSQRMATATTAKIAMAAGMRTCGRRYLIGGFYLSGRRR